MMMTRMFRIVTVCTAMFVSLSTMGAPSFVSAQSSAASAVHVQLNGDLVHFPDVKPFVDPTDHVQVPIRTVSEELGWDVDWTTKGSTTLVTVSHDGQSIQLASGESRAVVNGDPQSLDTSAQIVHDRMFVPLRFVAESFDLPVGWNGNLNMVTLGQNTTKQWLSEAKVIDCTASAYTAAPSENGGWRGLDYMGHRLGVGTVAVDPKVIPLGSKLFISGYSFDGLPTGGMFAVASDIGSAIKGNRVDLFVPVPVSAALTFGFQHVKVYVLSTP